MENIYLVILVLFGALAGFSFARFMEQRNNKHHSDAATSLLLAVVFAVVFGYALVQIWSR